ncbi:hypothetical protein ACQCN2_16935 [Brevibacillus ginsengisoli]|uniref:hypothetical protein n=1 Tax=Brevibacillus ginsengisoli TaxID=363854 RepID=UPI003CED6844
MSELQAYTSRSALLSSIEVVKELGQTDFETYTIVKEQDSPQHFLHYSFFHIKLSEGGIREDYDYFLPLDADEVLAFVLEEQPYQFPDHWNKTYLRSGTDDRLIPFEPTYIDELEREKEEELGILEALTRYKNLFENAEDKDALTQEFFKELEANRKKFDPK